LKNGGEMSDRGEVLTVAQVSSIYHLCIKTVQRKARAGDIPAFKAGKSWLFFGLDLETHFRANYTLQVQQGVHEKETSCHSTKESIRVKSPPTGGSNSTIWEKSYAKALGQRTGNKRKKSTTG
jgi:hypothetical protein